MRAFKVSVASLLASVALSCDLIPLRPQLERSWVIDTMDAGADACLIQENCFSGTGMRTILRFDSHVHNQGYSDCTVGWTPSCPRGDDSNIPDQYPFHYDVCHKHWHLTGFSRYHLTDRDTNQVVASGEKNGLCLMDVNCGGNKKYTCQNQGISAGCTDVYDKGLDCQWVDITDLDLNKVYDFTWEINPSRFIKENNYNNNFLTVSLNLGRVPRRIVRNSPAPNQCPVYNTLRTGGSVRTTAQPTYSSTSYTPSYSSPTTYGDYSGTSQYGTTYGNTNTYNSNSNSYTGYSGYSSSGYNSGYNSGYSSSGYSGYGRTGYGYSSYYNY